MLSVESVLNYTARLAPLMNRVSYLAGVLSQVNHKGFSQGLMNRASAVSKVIKKRKKNKASSISKVIKKNILKKLCTGIVILNMEICKHHMIYCEYDLNIVLPQISSVSVKHLCFVLYLFFFSFTTTSFLISPPPPPS